MSWGVRSASGLTTRATRTSTANTRNQLSESFRICEDQRSDDGQKLTRAAPMTAAR